MQTLKKQLPPLEPLVAFECASRHLSFTAAARELHLSQAAVSQQIRNLEQSIGTALFIRSHRSIRLSPQGTIYRNAISTALKQIASATAELKIPASDARLTVAADQSIASMWLIPRLTGFQQTHPGINVRLIASDIEQDCLDEDVDIAIIHGAGKWPGFLADQLFHEEVFPVCSPDYLRQHPEISSLPALTEATLLNLEDSYWDWMDWRTWLSSNEIHLPVQHQGLLINNYPLLIEAAKNGQGVALGWRFLIDQSLKNNSLIRPVEATVTTGMGYYLVWPDRRRQSASAAQFIDWCKKQLEDALQHGEGG